jgi:hypothetical protein
MTDSSRDQGTTFSTPARKALTHFPLPQNHPPLHRRGSGP